MTWENLPNASHAGPIYHARLVQIFLGFARFAPTIAFAALLCACWSLGGASQNNTVFMATLELLALGGLLVALAAANGLAFPREARPLVVMALVLVCLVCLQLLPLPWSIWSALPGHHPAARAFDLLQLPKTGHPISLTPESSISGLLKFIPAAAVFLIALLLPWRVLFTIVSWGALAAGLISVILGFVQAVGGVEGQFHLYDWTRPGVAAGVFANVNHQSTFLLMCLPFVAVLAARARARWARGESGFELLLLIAGAASAMLIGVGIAGSLSGYILAPFVVIGCAMLLRPKLKGLDYRYLAGGVALTVVALAIGLSSSKLDGLGQGEYFGGERARSAIHAHTLEAAADFMPLGSGLGSFDRVYPFYEDVKIIEPTYVNHAHNEYFEIALELGIPGVGLVLAFLAWWAREALRIWQKPTEFGSFQRMKMAASIAIAVVLTHSLADYPIRTATIACFVAAGLAIMVRRRDSKRGEESRAPSGLLPYFTISASDKRIPPV